MKKYLFPSLYLLFIPLEWTNATGIEGAYVAILSFSIIPTLLFAGVVFFSSKGWLRRLISFLLCFALSLLLSFIFMFLVLSFLPRQRGSAQVFLIALSIIPSLVNIFLYFLYRSWKKGTKEIKTIP